MDEEAQGDCLNMRLLKEKVQAIQSIPGYGAGRGRVLGFPMSVGGAADYCSIARHHLWDQRLLESYAVSDLDPAPPSPESCVAGVSRSLAVCDRRWQLLEALPIHDFSHIESPATAA